MKLELSELFVAQAKLDVHIQTQHGVDYVSTRSKRILALLVELGEMINETRVFKFWSKKGPSEKAIVLDEYADGIHFLLSLGLDLGSTKRVYEIKTGKSDLVAQILSVYEAVILLYQQPDVRLFEEALARYLACIPLLGFTSEDVIEGYFKKLGVNYTRQQTNY
jgi:dimeric dUTPase (all-alpha-NTP-PPase superfamily)